MRENTLVREQERERTEVRENSNERERTGQSEKRERENTSIREQMRERERENKSTRVKSVSLLTGLPINSRSRLVLLIMSYEHRLGMWVDQLHQN